MGKVLARGKAQSAAEFVNSIPEMPIIALVKEGGNIIKGYQQRNYKARVTSKSHQDSIVAFLENTNTPKGTYLLHHKYTHNKTDKPVTTQFVKLDGPEEYMLSQQATAKPFVQMGEFDGKSTMDLVYENINLKNDVNNANNKIDTLQSRISELENEIEELKDELDILDKETENKKTPTLADAATSLLSDPNTVSSLIQFVKGGIIEIINATKEPVKANNQSEPKTFFFSPPQTETTNEETTYNG
jgi:hypothetical protein